MEVGSGVTEKLAVAKSLLRFGLWSFPSRVNPKFVWRVASVKPSRNVSLVMKTSACTSASPKCFHLIMLPSHFHVAMAEGEKAIKDLKPKVLFYMELITASHPRAPR